ncbi:hypothetical protein SAMN05661080_04158 [Modestobacter sp. DSM 44400]|uniref:hypothetical protein n=1 Tax=Modestobacter sp. DSM 44400 TaxID=1550230 RepID=UPI0008947532|nr:hypothetical protein [Modestobacter sp. DSM 44400]SDY64825.1 hypothetical protein SAMN05661080_04158 [Modestobacter sp. DSM 44400]
MTEAVDPDPYAPDEHRGESTLGGRQEPADGDPTVGGKRGEIGETGSIAADEPDDGGPAIPVGGGSVTEEPNAAPVAGPGPGDGTSAGAGSAAADSD